MKTASLLVVSTYAWQTATDGGKFANKSIDELKKMMGGFPQTDQPDLITFY